MDFVITRQLETMNLWSPQRVVEGTLRGLPADSPQPEQFLAICDALMRIELPPHRDLKSHLRLQWTGPVEGKFCWAKLVGLFAVELQWAVGQPHFWTGVSYGISGEPLVAVECLEFEVGVAALAAATDLVNQMIDTGECDATAAFDAVVIADETYSLGDATGPLVAAARRRRLPTLRLDPESRVQLGEGIHARRIRKAVTDSTGFLAEQTSTDKAYTKQLWSRLGVPMAQGHVVTDADQAMQVALELGWPVVVKPLDSDNSEGVTLNVVDADGVRAAFDVARKESESILIERTLPGTVHRLLVVNNRVVSAIRRDPAGVTGDGRSTIRELVDAENQSPRRGPDYRWPLHRLHLESDELKFLAEQGMSPESVPAQGRRVDLRREPFLTAGGESHEVLHQVHPETLAIVCDAVRVIGLDVAGVDLIACDISVPLREQGGGLLELNAQPAICLHVAPFSDNPQPVAEAIIDSMFSPHSTGRVPLVVVVGDYADREELEPVARALSKPGRAVSVSTHETTAIGDRLLSPASTRPADRLATMQLHPRTAAMCLAATAKSICDHGLGAEQCQLLVLGDSGGGFAPELGRLLTRMRAVAKTTLVNVDDPVWRQLVEPGDPTTVMVSSNPDHVVLHRHLRSGGRVVTAEGGWLTLRSAKRQSGRVPLPVVDSSDLCVVATALFFDQPRFRRGARSTGNPPPFTAKSGYGSFDVFALASQASGCNVNQPSAECQERQAPQGHTKVEC